MILLSGSDDAPRQDGRESVGTASVQKRPVPAMVAVTARRV